MSKWKSLRHNFVVDMEEYVMSCKEEYGTLKELNVKPGDVVQTKWTAQDIVVKAWMLGKVGGAFRVISRASEESNERRRSESEVKTWGEMSDAEKGELLLAWQRGGQLQYWDADNGEWESTDVHPFEFEADAYRIKPVEPKRETVRMVWGYTTGGRKGYAHPVNHKATHKITFETLDGVPVLGSIKMEEV